MAKVLVSRTRLIDYTGRTGDYKWNNVCWLKAAALVKYRYSVIPRLLVI